MPDKQYTGYLHSETIQQLLTKDMEQGDWSRWTQSCPPPPFSPEWRPGMSGDRNSILSGISGWSFESPILSGISGRSFESPFLSPLMLSIHYC